MYQLVPYTERLVRLEVGFGDMRLSRLSGLARRANRLANAVSLVARPSRSAPERYESVPASEASPPPLRRR